MFNNFNSSVFGHIFIMFGYYDQKMCLRKLIIFVLGGQLYNQFL